MTVRIYSSMWSFVKQARSADADPTRTSWLLSTPLVATCGGSRMASTPWLGVVSSQSTG